MNLDLGGLRRAALVTAVVAGIMFGVVDELNRWWFDRHVLWFIEHQTLTLLVQAAFYAVIGIAVTAVGIRLGLSRGVPRGVALGVGLAIAAYSFSTAGSCVAYGLYWGPLFSDSVDVLTVMRVLGFVAPVLLGLLAFAGLRLAGVGAARALVGGIALGGLFYAVDWFHLEGLFLRFEAVGVAYRWLWFLGIPAMAALVAVRLAEQERETVPA